MKKKSTILFIFTFIIGVLACSFIMFLLFNVSMKESEGKAKEIKVTASEKNLSYTKDEDSLKIKAEDILKTNDLTTQESKKIQDSTNQNQVNETQIQENADYTEDGTDEIVDNTLISGFIDKSILLDASIQKITVNSAVDEVLIYLSDTKELEITQTYENLYKKDLFTVSEKTKEVVINTTSTGDGLLLPGNKGFTRKSTLEIKLPKDFSGTLDVSCDVGSILIKDELKVEELNLLSDIGDITIQKAQNIKKANIQCDIGNVMIKEAWNVNISSFCVEVGNVSFAKTINAKDFTVDVEIGNIVVPLAVKKNKEFSLEVELGTIKGY